MVSGSGTWLVRPNSACSAAPQQCTTTAQDTSGGDQPDEDSSSNNGHRIRRIRNTRWYLFRFYFKLVSAFPACVVDLEAKWEAWHKALSSSSEFASVPEHATLVALGPKAVPFVVWQVATHKDDATAVFLCASSNHPDGVIFMDAMF
ncbi:hypothetical protein VTI28DRAFT_5449 [Corynascus sepedonium]